MASVRHLFDPHSAEPFSLSRSKLELFLECPRCFALDRKHGIGRPDWMVFSLNLAVDALLKREFDAYRLRQEPHPLMRTYGVEAVPLKHPQLETWRDSPTGIRALHKESNILFYGIVDDLWQEADGTLIVVDYKATSTGGDVHVADIPRLSYERQLEAYQWILRRNGFKVSPVSYLVFANADKGRVAFDGALHFGMHLVPHVGDDSWVGDALLEARRCLLTEKLPPPAAQCSWCEYRKGAVNLEVQS